MKKAIRVMIIDDSLFFRDFLKRSLEKDAQLEIVGVFADPVEARQQIGVLRPNVIAVDMEMPKMRGDEFLRSVLPAHPGVQAVVISSLTQNVFDAMHAGAVDFVGKPNFQPGYDSARFTEDVVQKIKAAAQARPRSSVHAPGSSSPVPLPRAGGAARADGKSIIAMGASTGGTEALVDIFRQFPADMPGVVVVQHMPPVFTDMFAQRIDRTCPMRCREAKHGDRVEPGLILIAPGGDRQLRVKSDRSGYFVALSQEAKVSGHCPSADVLFDSVAKAAGPNALGVILTGMGSDGAKGLLEMRRAGAHTIGQDEQSCVVYGMPKVAFDLGAVTQQLPLSAIGTAVIRRLAK